MRTLLLLAGIKAPLLFLQALFRLMLAMVVLVTLCSCGGETKQTQGALLHSPPLVR
jgi:hypothetical protein